MFDIGFSEIVLIAVVALIVIGPERLPAVARTLGFWLGKTRRFVRSVQDDFNREVVKSEELKRLLEEQSKIKDVHEIIEQTVDDSRKTVAIGADLSSNQSANSEPAPAASIEQNKPKPKRKRKSTASRKQKQPAAETESSGKKKRKKPG